MALKLVTFALVLFGSYYATSAVSIFCYYDSTSFYRQGNGQMNISSIYPALQYCTHLIYGGAVINPENYTIEPRNKELDLDLGNYRALMNMKIRFPELKILLSVGGEADANDQQKYERLLESSKHRTSFVQQSASFLKRNGFDGIDLAYKFPTIPPKVIRGRFAKVWFKIKTFFVGEKEVIVDEHEEEHRGQFTSLLGYMKSVFDEHRLLVTVSVLPNVNSTAYFNIGTIKNYVDFVHLMAFDFFTPIRNPKEADHPASLHPLENRRPFENGNFLIQQWLENKMPNEKLILGIPMYGNTWSIEKESDLGIPPFKADGPGEAGVHTLIPGILSHYEVCNNENFETKYDTTNRFKLAYFYRPPGNTDGIWVGFDDDDALVNKASYAKYNFLGGVGVYDLSMDDFRGLCNGGKFRMLRKIAAGLY